MEFYSTLMDRMLLSVILEETYFRSQTKVNRANDKVPFRMTLKELRLSFWKKPV